jgi:phospholipase/carboxylesterase
MGLLLAAVAASTGCRQFGPVTTRVQARPAPPRLAVEPGVRPLDLGTAWYRGMRRDGTLLVPAAAASGARVPLLVVLHGGGGRADDFRFMLPLAEERGVALLLLDARHNTWDGVDSPFGPDVRFIDQALAHTFERVAVDPTRLALGGLSDGGMYALSIGVVNGDLFTHLIAVSAGFMNPPGPPTGTPRIMLGHGRRDTVYSVESTRDRLLPRLRGNGYDVTYVEFDGPHFITPDAARAALDWLVR